MLSRGLVEAISALPAGAVQLDVLGPKYSLTYRETWEVKQNLYVTSLSRVEKTSHGSHRSHGEPSTLVGSQFGFALVNRKSFQLLEIQRFLFSTVYGFVACICKFLVLASDAVVHRVEGCQDLIKTVLRCCTINDL